MTATLDQAVRAFAASLPEAWEDHPWGESVFKVGKKVFVFFGIPDVEPGLRLTVKLRESHEEALAFEWVVPSGYGLDRAGWVTCAAPADAPVEMLTGWVAESYRVVAPKRLAALLGQQDASAP